MDNNAEEKLERFQETILKSIKKECNEVIKTYASVTRATGSATDSDLSYSTEKLKVAL